MIVLDASAFLAFAQAEPGADTVTRAGTNEQFIMSAINYSEVVQKLAVKGLDLSFVEEVTEALGVIVVALTQKLAIAAADLFRPRSGLSLADRACIATANELRAPVYTADKAWRDWDLNGATVVVIR